jgi:hypothetical protein
MEQISKKQYCNLEQGVALRLYEGATFDFTTLRWYDFTILQKPLKLRRNARIFLNTEFHKGFFSETLFLNPYSRPAVLVRIIECRSSVGVQYW